MVKERILLLAVIALLAVGCEESLTPQQIQTWAGKVDGLSVKVDKLQDATTGAIDQLEADGLVNGKVSDQVGELNEEIDRLQPQIAEIAKAIEQANLAGKEVPAQWIELLQAANKTTATDNPYSGYIDVGLGGAAAVLGLLAARKNKEARVNGAKYKANRLAIERSLKDDKVTAAGLMDNVSKFRRDLGVS